jgi:hypothetical protein
VENDGSHEGKKEEEQEPTRVEVRQGFGRYWAHLTG